jgi:hypothetical protein
MVADDKAGVLFLDGPGRRKVATGAYRKIGADDRTRSASMCVVEKDANQYSHQADHLEDDRLVNMR